MKHVDIFTDGACKGNPGPGGWGVLLKYNGEEREMFGGEPSTTNNRMEMMAVIQALGATSMDGPVGTFAIHKAFSFQPVYLAKAGADGGFTIAKKSDPAEPQLSCPPAS